jgi:transcriptional regulator with XRE-family HTH domain
VPVEPADAARISANGRTVMSGGSEDTPHKQSIALTLRRLRTERKLTQSDVARETGISSSFLSLVEQGRSDITIGRLLRLAEFYEVELSDLLADEPGPEQNPVKRGSTCSTSSPARAPRW